MAMSNSFPGAPPAPRNANVDYLKAVNASIAERESVGAQATPYLLLQKSELEAKLGISVPEVPSTDPGLEHASADPLPENAARRGPGRPRKNPDADSTSGS
jgi:hypothetical protein